MRILGIDVSRHGVKIPFTSYRIPIPVFVTGLISIFGTPTTATNQSLPVTDSVFQPYGGESNVLDITYLPRILPVISPVPVIEFHSCLHFELEHFNNCVTESEGLFQSNDPNLGTSFCKIKVSCKRGGLDGNRPGKSLLTFLYNKGKVNSEVDKSFENCTARYFSENIIAKKCIIESSFPFQSTDPNLATSLCKAKLSCEMMDGTRDNILTVLYQEREMEKSPAAERELILSRFQNTVRYVLEEVFRPRLEHRTAKRLFRQDTTSFLDEILIGIKESFSEEGLGEYPEYLSALNCFRSRMDKLYWEMSEEHSAMVNCVQTQWRVDRCRKRLKRDPNDPHTMWEYACIYEIELNGDAFINHNTKVDGLDRKLRAAAEECVKEATLTLKPEEMIKPSLITRNGDILPSFRNMIAYRLRHSFAVRLVAQFQGYIPGSLNLHIFDLKKALRIGVQKTLTYYGAQSDPVYSSAMECFSARMIQYSEEFSKEAMTWETSYYKASQKDIKCVQRLKERQQAEPLRERWIELAVNYSRSFGSNSLEIPEIFEKQWSELEAQQLASNEQQPCGESFKKAVKGTTLYYFQSNAISFKVEQAAEDCHQKAKSNLKNEQKKFGMAS